MSNVPTRLSPQRRHAQPALDRLHRANAGRPEPQVQRALRNEFTRLGWRAGPSTMQQYARQIEVGRRVTYRAGELAG